MTCATSILPFRFHCDGFGFLSPLCWALDDVVASWRDFRAALFDPCHEALVAGRMQFDGRTSQILRCAAVVADQTMSTRRRAFLVHFVHRASRERPSKRRFRFLGPGPHFPVQSIALREIMSVHDYIADYVLANAKSCSRSVCMIEPQIEDIKRGVD
jgi:hypothetical protein